MEDIKKEIMIEKYPRPTSIKGTKEILNQMENCICKINKNRGGKGTGFFCNIKCNNYNIPVMMTNNHIIDEKYIKDNNIIELTLNDDNINKTIILNNNRKIYINKEYDITIIEIKCEKDKINNFMELDEKIFNEDSEIYNNNHSIYIPQYLNGDKAVVSYGIINKIDGYHINHYCYTDSGSSGSPIINLLNNKIIGIHKEDSNHFRLNKGTYLKYPINEFINKYDNKKEITLDINKDNINKRYLFNNKIIDMEQSKETKLLSNKRKQSKEKAEELVNNKEEENKESNKKEKLKEEMEIKKESNEKIKEINEEIEKRIKNNNYTFPKEAENKIFYGNEKIKEYQFEIKRPALNNMKRRNLKLYNYYNKILK